LLLGLSRALCPSSFSAGTPCANAASCSCFPPGSHLPFPFPDFDQPLSYLTHFFHISCIQPTTFPTWLTSTLKIQCVQSMRTWDLQCRAGGTFLRDYCALPR
jgi:hypothetical protein